MKSHRIIVQIGFIILQQHLGKWKLLAYRIFTQWRTKS